MIRPLTRQQLLDWNPDWSFDDKALIVSALDVLPEADYYRPNSNGYVAARVAGRRAIWIAPGYIVWESATFAHAVPTELTPRGLRGGPPDYTTYWYSLSTFRVKGPSATTPTFEELVEPCPSCFTIPSVSGDCICD